MAIGQALQDFGAEMNAQRTQQVYQGAAQRMAEVNKSMPVMTTAKPWPGRSEETNSLPTQQQLQTRGVFTGQVKSASDGTQYWEYRRPDGSIYWAQPGSGI